MNETKKKPGKKLWILLAAAVLLGAAAGIFFRYYTVAAGRILSRSAAVVDLRGTEADEATLADVRQKLPDAHILWDITIGGRTFDGESREIVTADFTADDIPAFARLTALERADVSACGDINVILALREALPKVKVVWTVPLGGENFDGDSESITVRSAGAEELFQALARLPSLRSAAITKCDLTAAGQLELTQAYPSVAFAWDVTAAGKTFPNGAAALDYSGATLTEDSLAEIAEALPLFAAAESVDFTGCGLPEDALRAFADAHPGLETVWETELFGVTFSTGAEEIDFSDIPLTVEDAAQIEALLPYMPNLKKVVMLRCGIENENMETINLRHENVQFVWMIQIYSYGVRTDQTYFTVYNCDYYYDNRIESAENLRYCHDMIAMDLGHLRRYGDTSFFSQMPHLRYLIITQTSHASIPELADCKELEYLEAGVSFMSDLTPLLGCPKLTDLNIVSKRTKGEGVQESDMEVLSQMKQLKRLYIAGNMYTDDQVQFLYDSLPDTKIVINYGPETAEYGWRDAEIYFEMRDAMHMYYMNGAGNMVMVNPYTGKRSEYEDTNPFPLH